MAGISDKACPAGSSPGPQRKLGRSLRLAFGQGDIQFLDRAAALVFEGDLNLILVDIDVLADHLNQLFLQRRQVVRLGTLAALMGDDDLQALFGDVCRGFFFLALAEEVQLVHSRAPNRRARNPCFLASRKRRLTSLPSRRSTASL